MREPDVDHISGSKSTTFFLLRFHLSAVALLSPSGKYIALLDPYTHFSRPEILKPLSSHPAQKSFSSTIPSFITSFLPSIYCLHIKSRYSVVSSLQQCSHSPLGCFPTTIAYCLNCFKCPILTFLLYYALFCYFPFSSVS